MRYGLEITASARRQFKHLPVAEQKRIRDRLEVLVLDPFARHLDVKKLMGREGYRLRVGDYRVIYMLESNRLIVTVLSVGHRRDIYH